MAVGKLYMAPLSPPVRSVLLLEKALGIHLEHEFVNILEHEHLKEDYLKLNPQHTIPCYKDQDGTVIWDSHAIMTYLIAKYAPNDELYPKDLARRALVDQRMHFDSGSCFGTLSQIVFPMWAYGDKGPPPRQIERAHQTYEFMNTFLDQHVFIAGDKLTVADFCLISSTTSLKVIVPIDGKFTKLLAWIKRCEALPYYQEANGIGLAQFTEVVTEILKKCQLS